MEAAPQELLALADDALLEAVARRTFAFFWEGAETGSLLARDRSTKTSDPQGDLVAVGGSGFGLMALVVAVERGWVNRGEALTRLDRMLALLERAERHHGAFPHFLHGQSGKTIPFGPKDDGGDLVETSFLMMGLITARQYFLADESLAARITALWESVEWNWYCKGENVLYWHWSPDFGWAMNHTVRGWNETLITYVLAAGAPGAHAIGREVYEQGFCTGPDYLNGKTYHGVQLPLGPELGGPLFFVHYSFLGLDPRNLRDAHADYWQQNMAHVAINRAHCVANPNAFKGYGPECWGITASDDPGGYDAHAPGHDNGTISPTAALSSFPYAPDAALAALRHFLGRHGTRIWGRFGFTDAFNETRDWWAETFLAIDQAPIVVMIENYRSGLLWKLFMSAPEVRRGLA
ncbi:MAG TPA: glucoamylase family protein, partial [Rhizomicrobium sp.]|nr:glucoamylase family protein [Rhizomicrobium sp.]